MSQDKKCIAISAGSHLLLIAALCLGAAMKSPAPAVNLPVLEFIPDQAVEDALAGGGGSPPPAAAPAAPSLPAPEPVQPPSPPPAPKVPEKAPEPEPEPVRPKVVEKKPEPSLEPAAKKPKETIKVEKKETRAAEPAADRRPKIQPNLKVVQADKTSVEKQRQAEENRRRAAAEAAAAAARARNDAIARVSSSLQQSFSGGTEIFSPGSGSGAYASYGQIVKSKYHHNWTPPAELNDDSATAEAKVVILRDGSVKSATVTKRSRHPSLNSSVERALQLRSLGVPFPEGSNDSERTFLIRFNLKARRGSA